MKITDILVREGSILDLVSTEKSALLAELAGALASHETKLDRDALIRVLREREQHAVEGALATFESALAEVRAALADVDPAVKSAARFKAKRLELLADLSRAALNVLRLLVDSARADAGPLKALSEALGRRPLARPQRVESAAK